VNEFNVVYQDFISMYEHGCLFCCKWSRLKPGFKVPAHHAADTHDTTPSHFKLTLGVTHPVRAVLSVVTPSPSNILILDTYFWTFSSRP